MRLNINNFAKIKEADIIVDGITIIAGENNTGKSTVGKVLFSLFNAASGIEDKIMNQRIKEIEENSRLLLRNYALYDNTPRNLIVRNTPMAARRISNRISRMLEKEDSLEHSQVYSIVEEAIKPLLIESNLSEFQEILYQVARKIEGILDLPEDTIKLEILSRYFNNIFYAQVNSLVEQETNASLCLSIKNKNINLSFANNECVEYKAEIAILHKAIYIDNPFILDKLGGYDELNTMDQFLKGLLTSISKDGIMDGIIETVLAKDKIAEIYQALQRVVSGQIIEKKDDDYYLEKEGFAQPIAFNNLSTGLKSFVIIKMLIEKGLIKEKDVLVLDEPEIHLHPQWQIAYAELIVLLQKYFDLSIIVTTHSPYFLDAINLFSVKHGLDSRVNYYLSSMEDNSVKMTCVTGNVELIYQKMASPIQMLDSLRYELSNK